MGIKDYFDYETEVKNYTTSLLGSLDEKRADKIASSINYNAIGKKIKQLKNGGRTDTQITNQIAEIIKRGAKKKSGNEFFRKKSSPITGLKKAAQFASGEVAPSTLGYYARHPVVAFTDAFNKLKKPFYMDKVTATADEMVKKTQYNTFVNKELKESVKNLKGKTELYKIVETLKDGGLIKRYRGRRMEQKIEKGAKSDVKDLVSIVQQEIGVVILLCIGAGSLIWALNDPSITGHIVFNGSNQKISIPLMGVFGFLTIITVLIARLRKSK
jgi:hypothetical protein|tara:strand:+ start:895 stop:1707 length:813 start_codon:yes stop_codon:yes gene_type:complete